MDEALRVAQINEKLNLSLSRRLSLGPNAALSRRLLALGHLSLGLGWSLFFFHIIPFAGVIFAFVFAFISSRIENPHARLAELQLLFRTMFVVLCMALASVFLPRFGLSFHHIFAFLTLLIAPLNFYDAYRVYKGHQGLEIFSPAKRLIYEISGR